MRLRAHVCDAPAMPASVYTLPVPQRRPKLIEPWPEFVILAVDRPATVDCAADGWPVPTRSWFIERLCNRGLAARMDRGGGPHGGTVDCVAEGRTKGPWTAPLRGGLCRRGRGSMRDCAAEDWPHEGAVDCVVEGWPMPTRSWFKEGLRGKGLAARRDRELCG